MVALATEGGLWYAARRNAQTAADLGAYAGVAQLAWQGVANAGQTAAINVGRSVAATNGFASGVDNSTVTVTPCIWGGGPSCAASTVNPNAVQVDISQVQRLGIARLISSTPPTVNVRAIAALRNTSSACMLSLNGQTTITGNNTLGAPNCAVASDRTGTSIDCGNSATITVQAFYAVGTASDPCDRGGPVFERQIRIEDPYAYIQSAALPSFRNQDCQTVNNSANSIRQTAGNNSSNFIWRPLPYNGTVTIPNNVRAAICDDIKINSGDQLILTPGTYFFADANLQVTGGTVSCPTCTGDTGVTLVFTQLSQNSNANNSTNRFGTIEITGGTINLHAPTTSPWYQASVTREDPLNPGTTETTSVFDGILVYRDYRATPNNTKNVDNASHPNTATITGNADAISMDGGFYFPSTQLFVAGTSAVATNQTDCQSIVASTIQVTGNSDVSITGCPQRGTTVAHARVIRLVQ